MSVAKHERKRKADDKTDDNPDVSSDSNDDDDDDEEEEQKRKSRWAKPWATLEAIKAAGPPIDMQTLFEMSDMLEFCEEKAIIVQKIYRGYLIRKVM